MDVDQALQYARDVGLTDRHIVAALVQATNDALTATVADFVTLTHPETGGVIQVHPDTVEQYKLAGWVPKEEDAAEEAPEAPKPRTRSK